MCENNIKRILEIYSPNLFNLINESFDYRKFCKKAEKFLKKNENIRIQKNFITVLFEIIKVIKKDEQNEYIEELMFIDLKIGEALEIIPIDKHNELGNLLKAMIFDFSQLSFLNPIGEILSLLLLNKRENYEFIDYEVDFPNKKTKDFKFKNIFNGKIEIVEVVNMSYDSRKYKNSEGLSKFICDKLSSKIKDETKGVSFEKYQNKLKFLIIIHGLNFPIARENEVFFKEFKKLKGKVRDDIKYDVFPIYSVYHDFVKGEINYGFDEITSLINYI